jgi:glycosyltransferase involved in cell wall biosynthesis
MTDSSTTFNSPTPLVSICLPTFNGAATVSETIRSILAQSFQQWELVISDDESTDNTLIKIGEFDDPRIRIIGGRKRSTPADNWNHCINHAQGKYIKVMGQDDLLLTDCIESEVEILDDPSYSELSFCFSKRNIISSSGQTIIRNRGFDHETDVVEIPSLLPKIVRSGTNIFGEPVAVMIRASALHKAGGFTGSYVIDLDMWIRLLEIGPARSTHKTLVAFRVGANSWSHALKSSQAHETVELYKLLAKKFPSKISRLDTSIGYFTAKINQWARSSVAPVLVAMNRYRPMRADQ